MTSELRSCSSSSASRTSASSRLASAIPLASRVLTTWRHSPSLSLYLKTPLNGGFFPRINALVKCIESVPSPCTKRAPNRLVHVHQTWPSSASCHGEGYMPLRRLRGDICERVHACRRSLPSVSRWGSRGRWFESSPPDHERAGQRLKPLTFFLIRTI